MQIGMAICKEDTIVDWRKPMKSPVASKGRSVKQYQPTTGIPAIVKGCPSIAFRVKTLPVGVMATALILLYCF